MTIWLARLIDSHAHSIEELQRDIKDMRRDIEMLKRRPRIKPPTINGAVALQLGIGITALALAAWGKTDAAQSVLGMLG